MEGLIETLTRGHVSEVKIVLASVLATLAVYQVGLMAVGYGRLRLPGLSPGAASTAHRAIGDAIVVITLAVSALCLAYFGLEAEAFEAHVPVALTLLGVFAFKIAVVRWWRGLSFLLPVLGGTLAILFVATWVIVAAAYLF